MDFYNIIMKGQFFVEILESLPTWTSSDKGRLVYDSTTNSVYFGTNTRWSAGGILEGGVTGQTLRKKSDNDFDVEWGVRITISNTEPTNPVNGQELWIDTTAGSEVAKIYLGSAWITLGSAYK